MLERVAARREQRPAIRRHRDMFDDEFSDLPLGHDGHPRLPGRDRSLARRSTADRALDSIRQRFGWEAIGYASVVLGSAKSVPDAFRELAEREL